MKKEDVLSLIDSGRPNSIIVVGSGNAMNADSITSSLSEIIGIIKENGTILITSDQNGIDYHIRNVAKDVGIKTKILSVTQMPDIYTREDVIHKLHFLRSRTTSAYDSIVIEGSRYVDRMAIKNPFSKRSDILFTQDDEGRLVKYEEPKKSEPKKKPSKADSYVSYVEPATFPNEASYREALERAMNAARNIDRYPVPVEQAYVADPFEIPQEIQGVPLRRRRGNTITTNTSNEANTNNNGDT